MLLPGPVFFPVIHPVNTKAALRSVGVAVGVGADGVFLIDQGMSAEGVLALAVKLRAQYPTLPVGINLLSSPAAITVRRLASVGAQMLWSDDAGLESPLVPVAFMRAREIAEQGGWQGAYFGGVAFKYRAPVALDQIKDIVKKAVPFVDVVTTSGDATGVPPTEEKIRTFRQALGDTHPLAVASGITPKNVDPYLEHVDAFLVATGIESSLGVLDEGLTRDLSDKIHRAKKYGRHIDLRGTP
jgi:predicted TIM-barrel enzyme